MSGGFGRGTSVLAVSASVDRSFPLHRPLLLFLRGQKWKLGCGAHTDGQEPRWYGGARQQNFDSVFQAEFNPRLPVYPWHPGRLLPSRGR